MILYATIKHTRRLRRHRIGTAADEEDARAFVRDCKVFFGDRVVVFYSKHEVTVKAPAGMLHYYCGLYDGWMSRSFDDAF